MARTAVPVNEIPGRSFVGLGFGQFETAGDVVNGHVVKNSGRMFLHLRNTDSVSRTISILVPTKQDGHAAGPRTITLAAGAQCLAGPFPADVYNRQDTDTDSLYLDADSTLWRLKAIQSRY